QGIVLSLQDQMEKSGCFQPNEINQELWDPLVREELLPENIVPDKHSRMKEMWDESLKLYDKRLDEFTLAQAPNQSILDKLDTADSIIDNAADAGDVILAATGTNSDLAKNIAAGVKLTLKAGISVGKAIVKKDLEAGFNSFPDSIGSIVTIASGSKDI